MKAIVIGSAFGGGVAVLIVLALTAVFGAPAAPWGFLSGWLLGSAGARAGIKLAKAVEAAIARRRRARWQAAYMARRGDAA